MNQNLPSVTEENKQNIINTLKETFTPELKNKSDTEILAMFKEYEESHSLTFYDWLERE